MCVHFLIKFSSRNCYFIILVYTQLLMYNKHTPKRELKLIQIHLRLFIFQISKFRL